MDAALAFSGNVATAMAKFENKVTDDADGISDTGTLRQDSGC